MQPRSPVSSVDFPLDPSGFSFASHCPGLFATSCLDGHIRIWNAQGLCLQSLSSASPVAALAPCQSLAPFAFAFAVLTEAGAIQIRSQAQGQSQRSGSDRGGGMSGVGEVVSELVREVEGEVEGDGGGNGRGRRARATVRVTGLLSWQAGAALIVAAQIHHHDGEKEGSYSVLELWK